MQVAAQAQRGLIQWRVKTACVAEILPVRVVARAHKTNVRPGQRQPDAVILLGKQRPSLDFQLRVFADRLDHFEAVITGSEPLLLSPMLAKLLFVAAHGDPLRHRRDGKLRFAFDGLRARRPARAVIHPFSNQADLFRRQRLAFP